jgi:hypothetical protein
MRVRSWILLFAALPAALQGPLIAQTPLPVGSTRPVSVPAEGAAELTFEASAAGFLTVVVRSTGGEDISLSVTDDEFQSLPGAAVDGDIGGNLGAEQLVVGLPRPGRYVVVVEALGGDGAGLEIGATFLPTTLAALADDPDGRPSGAVSVATGASRDDTIDPSRGDMWDWHRIEVVTNGVLTLLTRTEGEGDLRLEVFEAGSYREPLESSDQDMGGVLGNESVTLTVQAGASVYARVSAFNGNEAIKYRLASGLIPG